MKILVALIVFGSVFTPFFSLAAVDDGLHIQPLCLVQGPLYLAIHADYAEGYIGTDPVFLARYQDYFYGDIKKVETKLNVYRGNIVKGTVGTEQVQWRITREDDALFGYQPCLMLQSKSE